ncbi:MAG TPA: HAD-IA family hydrolase, partial [Ktedonobacterales bacterium]|nr:HAD-IA family hydrolase [Ktedonobacterales bacterium]
ARWDTQLQLGPGELDRRLTELGQRLASIGKDGALGTLTEAEWRAELQVATGMDDAQTDIFLDDFWNVYLGELNVELADYFAGLRPRYRTALLSNSFIGARERECGRYRFDEMCDLIIYSHEVGIAKPDPRIYELTCQRLSLQPAEIVFLDDAPRCVAGAHDAGLHTILYRDTAQAIADLDACLRANGV